jgi:hypothetical protein
MREQENQFRTGRGIDIGKLRHCKSSCNEHLSTGKFVTMRLLAHKQAMVAIYRILP